MALCRQRINLAKLQNNLFCRTLVCTENHTGSEADKLRALYKAVTSRFGR